MKRYDSVEDETNLNRAERQSVFPVDRFITENSSQNRPIRYTSHRNTSIGQMVLTFAADHLRSRSSLSLFLSNFLPLPEAIGISSQRKEDTRKNTARGVARRSHVDVIAPEHRQRIGAHDYYDKPRRSPARRKRRVAAATCVSPRRSRGGYRLSRACTSGQLTRDDPLWSLRGSRKERRTCASFLPATREVRPPATPNYARVTFQAFRS